MAIQTYAIGRHVEAEGNGKIEARQKAEEKVSEILDHVASGPYLVAMRGKQILVYPSVYGIWFSCVVDDNGHMPKGFNTYQKGISRGQAITFARIHLLQITWKPEDGLNHPEATKEENEHLQSWFDFQLRYKEAASKGMNYNDSFAYAQRDPRRMDLWKDVA